MLVFNISINAKGKMDKCFMIIIHSILDKKYQKKILIFFRVSNIF